MKKIIWIIVVMMIAGALCTSKTLWAADSPKTDPNVVQKIKTIMGKQVEAWNRGDIDGFMAGYWKSEKFTFQSGNKRLMGWDQLIAMYKKNYAGDKMGKLEFTDIEVKAVCTDTYLVLGRWRVTTKKDSKEGLFTLLFRRFGKDWKIIHDHSS